MKTGCGWQSKRIIRAGLVGGLIAAASAWCACHFLSWSMILSIGVLLIIAIIVAAILTGYSWLRNDFYISS